MGGAQAGKGTGNDGGNGVRGQRLWDWESKYLIDDIHGYIRAKQR